MTMLEEIETAILQLPQNDFWQLSHWIAELNQDRWDKQLERDAAAGKLDALADEALNEHKLGRTRRL